MRDRPHESTTTSADAVGDRPAASNDYAGGNADARAAAADHWASGCERVIEKWLHETSLRRLR
jgi:hypothetical protein